jgi:cytoskeletal protein CcmA (bactofilin family)
MDWLKIPVTSFLDGSIMALIDLPGLNGSSADGKPAPAPEEINIVGEGTTIKGDIRATGNVRIGGTLDGEIRSEGKVVVGSEGTVEGTVTAGSADIAGRVTGDVLVDHLLVIRGTGTIKGNIRTEKLVIEDGAVFTGECIMHGSSAREDDSHPPRPGSSFVAN